MDAISLGVLVTVLSVGALLIVLFKRDYNQREQQRSNNGRKSSRDNLKTPNKTSSNNPGGTTKGKHVHFAETISTNSSSGKPLTDSKQPSNGPSVPHQSAPAMPSKANQANYASAQAKAATPNSPAINRTNPKLSASKNTQSNEQSATTNTPHQANTHAEPQGSEPSIDELDTSVLLEVFNPTRALSKNNKSNNNNGEQAKQNHNSSKNLNGNKSTPRKRQNSDQTSYSSEKLFNIIAASNLSKEEVELAVETLLNKLESGESDWHQPKSDPIQRLKNQLRDAESALATEVQNHRQTRARLQELKTELQGEKSSRAPMAAELANLKKEFGVVNLALEKAHSDLAQQKLLQSRVKEESAKVIDKLEQENVHLQALLAKSSVHDDEVGKLRNELEDKLNQLQRYELSNQSLSKKIQELEANLRSSELQMEQMRTNKQHDDYEACAKISELDSDRKALDKALKDQMARLKELAETNNLLEKSNKELQIMNGRQDDLLKRLRDERHITEAQMKRTLNEMQDELRELHEKLSSKTVGNDERLRKEIDQFERELNHAGQREQKLAVKMQQLREGLSELFPEIQINNEPQNGTDEWVHSYLVALRQLARTVDELRKRASNDNNNNMHQNNGTSYTDNRRSTHQEESPSKPSLVDKSTITNGSTSRVGSPNNNGRSSSRASSHGTEHEKRLMETKLVELNDYVQELERTVQLLEAKAEVSQNYEQQIKELQLQRSKLEAQIRFGLDSLKMEQERASKLEEKLTKCSSAIDLS